MAMAPTNRPLGGLTVGAGGQMLTPQQVAEQRKVAAALMQQAGDTSPVGHWTAALNRGLQGYLGGRDMFRANETESNETARALSAFQNRSGMQQPSPVASALAGGQAPEIPAGADGIRQGLISRGLPEHIADAFILNFQDESGLNPGINEISPTVPGSRGGFGLYQLTGPRRTAYEAFAADRGVNPADVDAQLDWLMYELQGPESRAAQNILSAQDTGTAAAAIVNDFLRPAPEHRTARANRYMGGAGAGVSAAPAAGNVSEIAALLADPWLPASARGVLEAEMNQQMQMQNAAYEAQLQNQDPLRQLQIQQAQLALEAAQNPTVDPWEGVEEINGQLVRMGANGPEVIGDYRNQGNAMTPVEVNGQLVNPLTGEVIGDYRTQEPPSAPTVQTFYDEATGQEYKAQFNPETMLWDRVGGNASPAAPLVNVNTGENSNAFVTESDKMAAGRMGDIVSAANAIPAMQADFDRLTQLGAAMQTGRGAQLLASLGPWAEALGADIEGLGDLQAYDAIVARMAPQMRPAGSGASSDLDARQFLLSLPSIGNTPEGNALIIETFNALNQNKVQAGEIARRAQMGEISWQEAEREISNLPNPYARFNEFNSGDSQGASPQQGTASVQQTHPRPQSADEFNALPSGSMFYAPDGSLRRKP